MLNNTTSSVLEDFGKTRIRRIARLNRPESLFSRSAIANTMLAVFCLTDLTTLYTTWNSLLLENPFMLICIIIAFVIGLDVTMSIAGNVIKQCRQGLRPVKDTVLIAGFCILAFLGVYVFYFWLRLSMTEITFGSVGAASSIIDMTGAASSQTSEAAEVSLTSLAASFSLAFLPFVTSVASFAVSAAVSDPLGEKLCDLRKQRAEVEAHITRLRTELTESENTETHIKRLYEREYRLYDAFIRYIERTALSLKLKVREIIMKKMGKSDANMISAMTEDCRRLTDAYNEAHSYGNKSDSNDTAEKESEQHRVLPAVLVSDISYNPEMTA